MTVSVDDMAAWKAEHAGGRDTLAEKIAERNVRNLSRNWCRSRSSARPMSSAQAVSTEICSAGLDETVHPTRRQTFSGEPGDRRNSDALGVMLRADAGLKGKVVTPVMLDGPARGLWKRGIGVTGRRDGHFQRKRAAQPSKLMQALYKRSVGPVPLRNEDVTLFHFRPILSSSMWPSWFPFLPLPKEGL